jgi:hypothetical protein
LTSVSILDFAQAEVIAVIGLLRAYVDEFNDYTDPACDFFGMQGLVGPVEAWHRLQCKWEDALDCCGLSHFHSTDLQAREGEFRGWTNYQSERLMSLLINIVRENMGEFHLLGSAVFMSSYKFLPQYRSCHLKNPYFLCAMSAMSDATRVSHYHFGDTPVEFVFDQKSKHQQWINLAYDDVLLTKYGHLCAAKSMANHRLVSPVQVADLVAYEAGKYIQARMRRSDALEPEFTDLRWPIQRMSPLFWGSDTTLYNWHALMLVTDFWNNYRNYCRFNGIATEETHEQRKRRIQEIRRSHEQEV